MSEESQVTSPIGAGVEITKFIGLKWGPAGLLVVVIFALFSGVIWFLVKYMDLQNEERREDKKTIIAMTATVTKVASDTADSNDKLSLSIDKHSRAIEDLQRTIERRTP